MPFFVFQSTLSGISNGPATGGPEAIAGTTGGLTPAAGPTKGPPAFGGITGAAIWPDRSPPAAGANGGAACGLTTATGAVIGAGADDAGAGAGAGGAIKPAPAAALRALAAPGVAAVPIELKRCLKLLAAFP